YEECADKNFSLEKCRTAIIDYHFNNSELNGIEIIAKLREQGFKNLYLCTAEYWKPLLKKQAAELGVAICPKPLPKIQTVQRSTFNVQNKTPNPAHQTKSGYHVLVIDDEEMIRMSWEFMTKKLGIATLHSFASLEELQASDIDLSRIDIAFVDKNIKGSKYGGAEVIAYLKSKQVAKIILASGENVQELREDPQWSQADFITNTKIPTSFQMFFS
ncbi:MAG: response regulator, partial [Patescibacteria group bacterium]